MTPQGEDRPPDEPEEPKQPEPPAEGDKPERPEKPEYTVYRAGKGDAEEGVRRELPAKAKKAETGKSGEKPDYRVYRSRPSLRDRFGSKKPDLASIRKGAGDEGGGGLRSRLSRFGGGGRRRWLRWVLI